MGRRYPDFKNPPGQVASVGGVLVNGGRVSFEAIENGAGRLKILSVGCPDHPEGGAVQRRRQLR
jgi:hypothetical protein